MKSKDLNKNGTSTRRKPFTGFYDKNGNKIYDGDTISLNDISKTGVVFKRRKVGEYRVRFDNNDKDTLSLKIINCSENVEVVKQEAKMKIGFDKDGNEIKVGDVLFYRELVGTEVGDESDEVEYEEYDHYIKVVERDNEIIVCDMGRSDEWWFLHQFPFETTEYKIVDNKA